MRSDYLLGLVLSVYVLSAGCSQAKMEDVVTTTKKSAGDAAQAVGESAASVQEAAGEAAEAAKDAVAGATDAVAGAAESASLTKDFGDLFASMTKSLSAVSDADSASTAGTQLSDMGETVKGLVEKFNALPPTVKSTVAGAVAKGLENLKPLIEKVLAIPGAGDALKPHIDGIMSQLGEVAEAS